MLGISRKPGEVIVIGGGAFLLEVLAINREKCTLMVTASSGVIEVRRDLSYDDVWQLADDPAVLLMIGEIRADKVKIGVQAPRSVRIDREEIAKVRAANGYDDRTPGLGGGL